MKKVCLIIPYFGRKPPYFELWLKSASYNSSYDFVFLTDVDLGELPSNVRSILIEFSEIKEKIQKLFDFPIVLKDPYKLCDYKPAYGYIFSDIVKEYTFWGYCDVDLIFGDLDAFITKDLLETKDKIYSLGHLTLYRNIKKMNELFMKELQGVINYREAFSTNYVCHFDESGIVSYHNELGLNVYNEYDFWDINAGIFPFKSHWGGEWTSHIFEWNKGKLIRYYVTEERELGKQEICYVHMQKRIMQNRISRNEDSFMIIPNYFIDLNPEYRTRKAVLELNPEKFYPEAYKMKVKQFKNNLQNGAIGMRLKSRKKHKD